MSELESRLLRLPETNVEAWEAINRIVLSEHGGWQPGGKSINVSYYIPGTDTWEFADISEAKQRAVQDILRKHPLGGDHFQQWLEKDEVKLPYFNHPTNPTFIAAYCEMHWLCEKLAVSHSLNFDEAEGSWYLQIRSAAVGESFTGKNSSLSTAMESGMEHLFKIGKSTLLELREMNPAMPSTPVGTVLQNEQLIIAYRSGRSFIEAGKDFRTPHRVTGVRDIQFHNIDDGWLRSRQVAVKVTNERKDVDEANYDIEFDGEKIGRLQFDFGNRSVEWDIARKYEGIGLRFTVLLSSKRP